MLPPLTLLERQVTNNLNYLYFVDHPVYQIQPDRHLMPANEFLAAGTVTAIECDEQERYHIYFTARSEITISSKKVRTTLDAAATDKTDLLTSLGYYLFTDDSPTADSYLPNTIQLTALPTKYIIVDCEFSPHFHKVSTAKTITWQMAKSSASATNIFQLSAIGFDQHQQTSPFFNRYLDDPDFLPEKKLAGLAATGLTTTAYETQGDPLTIIKVFIAQILQPQLPLVFWDQKQDMKHLIHLLATYYNQLTIAEQAIVKKPITTFDAQDYTNRIINRGNHKQGNHTLPLNGLAALFNIVNSHQHNAIWDVQTTEHVIQQLAILSKQAIVQITEPAPKDYCASEYVVSDLPLPSAPVSTNLPSVPAELSPQLKLALVYQLRAHGQTYREIAVATGLSINKVNYLLKKARGVVTN